MNSIADCNLLIRCFAPSRRHASPGDTERPRKDDPTLPNASERFRTLSNREREREPGVLPDASGRFLKRVSERFEGEPAQPEQANRSDRELPLNDALRFRSTGAF